MRGNKNEILFPMKCSNFEKFEDAKRVIISCNVENRQYNSQKNKNKKQTMVDQIQHRKLKIEQREHH